MSIASRLRKGVERAFAKFGPSLPEITVCRYLGEDADNLGHAVFADPEQHRALIENRVRFVKVGSEDRVSRARATLKAEVGLRDRITLPDGTSPSILDVESILDEAGNPYFTTVFF